MPYDFVQIAENFELKGLFTSAVNLQSGHVNKTYLVTCQHEDEFYRYILQKLKSDVFSDPVKLVENIANVCDFLKVQMERENTLEIGRKLLKLVKSTDGRNYYIDPSGNFWRVYAYIENTCSYRSPKDENFAYQAGKVCGNFQRMLAKMPTDGFYEPIPDFHNGQKRFLQLCNSIRKDPSGRVKSAQKEINFVLQNKEFLFRVEQVTKNLKLKKFVTHNDMKMNNILFDINDGHGLALVDFDTVMPGHFAFDFGDLVRTGIQGYDGKVGSVAIKPEYFRAICMGYLSSMHELLDVNQRKLLLDGVLLMPLMLACRYLTDYIDGDNYFNVSVDGENLSRAQLQLGLFKSLKQNFSNLKTIFNESFDSQSMKKRKAARL